MKSSRDSLELSIHFVTEVIDEDGRHADCSAANRKQSDTPAEIADSDIASCPLKNQRDVKGNPQYIV